MTTVYLARHGESDWNVERRWQGHADRPLTERGREQAQTLAERLANVALDAVYASDLRRAWETAEAVAAPRGLEVVRLRELREVDVGSWSGFTREECAKRFPAAFARWQDGGSGWEDGESYEAMGQRIVGTIQRIAAEERKQGRARRASSRARRRERQQLSHDDPALAGLLDDLGVTKENKRRK